MTAVAAPMPLDLQIGLPREIQLDLIVRDPDTILDLWRRRDPIERSDFALAAMRIGTLAMRQAAGSVDADTIRHEGEHLVAEVRELLTERSTRLTNELAAELKSYFDPTDGQLLQRLDRLVKSGGDLDGLLSRHISGDGSALARTLADHVGQNSPLLRKLSPEQSDGILAAMAELIESAMGEQHKQVQSGSVSTL